MGTFIQLRDGVGFAHITTPQGEPDHTVTPDHTTSIEVFTDSPDQFLNKKYDEETKSWSNADIIYYAEVNQHGQIIEIGKTYFTHLIPTGGVIMPSGADSYWKYIDNQWVEPIIFIPSQIIDPDPQPAIASIHVDS